MANKDSDTSRLSAEQRADLHASLRRFMRAQGAGYLRDPNISSIGVGYKIRGGRATDELAIQFTVASKAVPEALNAMDTTPIPETITVDGVVVPTDVVERVYKADFRVVAEAPASERKKRLDPIKPGISVGHVDVTAGTIGCLVFDSVDGTPYVLSNWHVLNGPTGKIGDTVVQPGVFDDNRIERNRLGHLVRSHVGHAGDCAIATIEGRQASPELLDLNVAITALGDPELGDTVVKSGRTTAVTRGIVRRVDTIAKIDYGGSVGVQEVGGFEIGVDPAAPAANGEISQGGDSGAAWVFTDGGKPTGVMAGLHFAGESGSDPDEHALACLPASVFEKLQITLTPPAGDSRPAAIGYDREFLGVEINVPELDASIQPDAVEVDGSTTIDYTHFSLAHSKSRGFAIWVAWNIDGGQVKNLSRVNIPFVKDPRIPEKFQVGNELYRDNRLDRGHLARRADLVWGPLAEARQANKDSFFYTNITPQMDNFNQSARAGLWGLLENALFADVDVDDLKISVLGGPVFSESDRRFRGVLLPREFWKILVFTVGGELRAKAFLLTQNLDHLESLDLDEFRVFQVTLAEIEQRAHFLLPPTLHNADTTRPRIEAVTTRTPLETTDDIDWT
jgi:endonuclease G, mitochondrial